MNQIFTQLADKASQDCMDIKVLDREKYAQLIVEECIKQCKKNYIGMIGQYPGVYNSAVEKCIDSITYHFYHD